MRARDFVREAKKHISPSGVETTMDPRDDDYAINYGKNGGVAKFRKSQGLDVRTGSKKIKEQGMSEDQVTERSQDYNERLEAVDQLFKMFMKFREKDFAGIKPEDIKKMKQLVSISGRGHGFWASGIGSINAGQILDRAVQEYREAQARAGQMPEFSGRAPTSKDLAQQIAQQTRGRYDYNSPVTWTTGSGQRHRDPGDYIVYPDEQSLEDAWQWIQGKGQKVHYYDSFKHLNTAIKIGRYIVEPASFTRGAFSDSPETTHRMSVRSAASINQGVRTRADITDQQAAALRDIAATKNANAMTGIRAIMSILQGEEDLKRVIDSSRKIDPRDKAKLDAIIAAAGKNK